jgi:deoxycytidylate deaminase
MKSDNYLNLCLEQASLSPLHHRHGCIVVKGGKVIGKGYNDYRPGYDGGALKTGQLPKGSVTSTNTRLRSKSKPKSNLSQA